ncbi:hypothetical protein [Brachybacterium phenoliresistens]|uniref:hypothetical protein n=1 Tax=Brachybacterium phenoliresistens TaxID=396014 RepID=UPI0031D83579
MSEQDGLTPSPRRPRPVYGLPASPPGPGEAPPDPQAPSSDAGWAQHPPAGSMPPAGSGPAAAPASSGAWGQPSAQPAGHAGHTPGPAGDPAGPYGQGPSAPSWQAGSAQSGPQGPASVDPGRRRGRGTIPLVLGLVMLLVLAPAALVIGLVLSVNHLVGDAVAGPTVMPGSTATVEVPSNSMVIVYVPEADAATAECTAEGEGGTVTVVPQSSTVQFGDGSTYHQVLGAVAQGDTRMTITCTGTTADAAYLGPYSIFGMAGPMLAGIGGGVLLGLVGLVLLIVGIVTKVRGRRA